jgi:GTP pyrophosphokinase
MLLAMAEDARIVVIKLAERLDSIKAEVFRDRVHLLTPKGKILDLPQYATPLDFAYHIHTEVGHRCRGAKMDGRIVPLSYALNSCEQVEILTVKSRGPSRDWINPHLGYLETNKAHSKVQQWFRQLDYNRNVADGRTSLDRELKRLGSAGVSRDKLAQRLKYARTDELLAAIGRGDIKPPRISGSVRDILGYERRGEAPAPEAKPRVSPRPQTLSSIRVQGVDNLVTRLAGCCQPLPEEPILGYITRGSVSQSTVVTARKCLLAQTRVPNELLR